MKAIGNNVVVRIDSVYSPMKVNGVDFLVDHTWEPGVHAVSFGTVSSVSDMMLLDQMEWEPVVDVLPGDKVWFQKYEATRAIGRELDRFMDEFEENDSKIGDEITLPFSSLFCVERDGRIIMQNGFVLVEPLESRMNSILEMPLRYRKNELSLGRVYEVGEPNKSYDYYKYVDTVGYKKGDLVLFRRYNNFVHTDIHNKELYKIQRRNIIAVHCKEN